MIEPGAQEMPWEVERSIKEIYRKNWASRIASVRLSLGELEDLALAYGAPWRTFQPSLPWCTVINAPPWRPVQLGDMMRKEIANLKLYSQHLSLAYENYNTFMLPTELEDLKEPVLEMKASLSTLDEKIGGLNDEAEELFASGLLEKYVKKKEVLMRIKRISYIFDNHVLSAGKQISENPYFKAFHRNRERLGCIYIGE